MNYLVRRWHIVKSENVHTDQEVDAPTPEEAARNVAAIHGDQVTRLWGPYKHLIPSVLFLIGCNSEDGPDTASVEVYDPEEPPPNWMATILPITEESPWYYVQGVRYCKVCRTRRCERQEGGMLKCTPVKDPG